ncbi:MAG: hypothetical protein B6A08_17165 [Sorangiineae bacterium NIC37A_2]|jgi:hypothetical protein|nr:MAG: hypothetical protein B6A08_17165 [Sorangiineae bacterium NIC37A_2]
MEDTTNIYFFPVGNGDMTLIKLRSGRTILIDINIRQLTGDDPPPDVAKELKELLSEDALGRPFVDAFLLSHPDQDHCRGLEEHFYLGDPASRPSAEKKIFIRELWSSPRTFRRHSKNHTLCPDAKAFAAEGRRRVKEYRAGKSDDGNRIKLMGHDVDGKTDDIASIVVEVGAEFSSIAGVNDSDFKAKLLGPWKPDDGEEENFTKNNNSVILSIQLGAQGNADACKFLTGGDAEVSVWEKLWSRAKDDLEYDLLQAPHHCSWHSLSSDSWSKSKSPKVSADAKSALSQTRPGAFVVASSNKIEDDDNDPPCIGAKREYTKIVSAVSGEFVCVGDPKVSKARVFEVFRDGPRLTPLRTTAASGGGVIGTVPLQHG